jgi:mono/diheme cytochrome c family protein
MKAPARWLLPFLASAAFSAGVGQAHAAAADRGLTFVKANCAICHAIGRHDESPLAIAPPLRTLHELYPVEELEESLAEGIVTGHPSMPQFQLDLAQINDLIAYLKTLE